MAASRRDSSEHASDGDLKSWRLLRLTRDFRSQFGGRKKILDGIVFLDGLIALKLNERHLFFRSQRGLILHVIGIACATESSPAIVISTGIPLWQRAQRPDHIARRLH